MTAEHFVPEEAYKEKAPSEPSLNKNKNYPRRSFLKTAGLAALSAAFRPHDKGLFHYEGGKREFSYPTETSQIIEEIKKEIQEQYGFGINFGPLPKEYQNETGFSPGKEVAIEYHEAIAKRVRSELAKYPPELLKGLGQTELFITESSSYTASNGESKSHAGWYGGTVKGANILVLNFFPREKIEKNSNGFVLMEEAEKGHSFNHGINHEVFHLINAYYKKYLLDIWKKKVENDPRYVGYPTTRLEDVNTVLQEGEVKKLTMVSDGLEKETLPNMVEDAAEIGSMLFEDPNIDSFTKDDLRWQKILAIKEFFFKISGGAMNEKYWHEIHGIGGVGKALRNKS